MIRTPSRRWVSFVLSLTMAVILGPAYIEAGSWSAGAPMLSSRGSVMAVGIGERVYAVGGYFSVSIGFHGSGPVSTTEVYDPTSNTWSALAPLPEPRTNGTAGAIAGKLYVAGGFWDSLALLATNTLFVYDPVTAVWTTAASMPISSACSVGGVIEEKLYVLTACDGSPAPEGRQRRLLHVYDPATNAWTSRATAPHSYSNGASGVIAGKLYVVGGASNTLDVYDPSTDTWTTKTPMPSARSGLAASVIDGRLYVVGGFVNGVLATTVEVYNPITDAWTTDAPMPTARTSVGSAALGRRLYAVGGGRSSPGDTATLEIFAADALPAVRVAINGTQFRPGQPFVLGLNAENPASGPPADLYVGAVLPGGVTALFLSTGGEVSPGVSLSRPASFQRMQAAPPGSTINLATLLSFTFPEAGVPAGTYYVFAALVRLGALQDDRIDPGDVLALDVRTFVFSP